MSKTFKRYLQISQILVDARDETENDTSKIVDQNQLCISGYVF